MSGVLGVTTSGSSPLARGALPVDLGCRQGTGIIPARAGSTLQEVPHRRHCGDHPRSRGEHPVIDFIVAAFQGSSPLARGAHQGRLGGVDRGGIIPARAGSTGADNGRAGRTGDHPRSRGEHVHLTEPGGFLQGSSPLARGARTPRMGSCGSTGAFGKPRDLPQVRRPGNPIPSRCGENPLGDRRA